MLCHAATGSSHHNPTAGNLCVLRGSSSSPFASFSVESPIDCPPQLHHLYPHRTLLPIVPPAHNHIAPVCRMPVRHKIPALKFQLNSYSLPLARLNLPHGQHVGKLRLHPLHLEPELNRQHAKQY